MDLSVEWTVFLLAIIGALIPIIPVAGALLRTYIQAQQNKLELQKRPTHDQVSAAIDAKVEELANNGTNTAGTG